MIELYPKSRANCWSAARDKGIADDWRVLHDLLGQHRLAAHRGVIERTRVPLHYFLDPRFAIGRRHFNNSVTQQLERRKARTE